MMTSNSWTSLRRMLATQSSSIWGRPQVGMMMDTAGAAGARRGSSNAGGISIVDARAAIVANGARHPPVEEISPGGPHQPPQRDPEEQRAPRQPGMLGERPEERGRNLGAGVLALEIAGEQQSRHGPAPPRLAVEDGAFRS